jgi:hypothetical protein
LHVVCHLGDLPKVQLLLRKKADVTAITDSGFTPLHVAAQHGHTEIIAALVAAGAVVNAKTRVGCTPLHESAAKGHEQATIKLLELGADPSSTDFRYELTPANLAHENGFAKVRDILCNKMNYQDCFIQNVNFILFTHKRAFTTNSQEFKFIQELSLKIKDAKEADEVFKTLNVEMRSPRFKLIEERLKPTKQLLVMNMKKYNENKLAFFKKASEVSRVSTEAKEGQERITPLFDAANPSTVVNTTATVTSAGTSDSITENFNQPATAGVNRRK